MNRGRTVNDPRKREELHKANQQLKSRYEAIADTLRPGAAAAAAINDEKRKIEKVKTAAERGGRLPSPSLDRPANGNIDATFALLAVTDAAGLDSALNELQEASYNLQRKVEARASHIDDPSTKRDVLEALNDLNRLLPLEGVAAKKLVKQPQNRQAQNELADACEKAKVLRV